MEMEVDFYMSKSEKKAGPGEGKNGKKKWIIVGVVVVLGTVIWVLDTAFSGALSLIVG